jgi:major membrane immunogen (membrane-anchored lipoprotein)
MKKLLFAFAVAALSIANAASYRVTLYHESIVNGTTLKPGDYKLEVGDNQAVISKGKQKVEAPVKIETAENKFSSTSVRYQNGDGKYKVIEIRLGGTNQKLVFDN